MKSSITRLLVTVLCSTSILIIPLKQAKAVDYRSIASNGDMQQLTKSKQAPPFQGGVPSTLHPTPYPLPPIQWDNKTITQDVVDGSQVVGQVKLPDWDLITFEDFPLVGQGGSLSSEFNSYVGYDLSRQWLAGDSVVDILKLGDLEEAFAIQEFTIDEIISITGTDAEDISLSSFELVQDQSLSELVEAVPGLGQKQVFQVEPIAELIETELGLGYENITLESLVEFDSLAPELKLEEIELSEYSIDDIPGLEDTELEDFARWENAYLSDVPELSQVPLSQMPIPLANAAMPVMRIDAVWGDAESNRYQTVSGSYEEGFNVPCDSRCSYIELDDWENSGTDLRLPTEGLQWISGRDPEKGNICPDAPWGVNGGRGLLGILNCGKEPTGRHPFGKLFKLAVWSTDETTDSVETAIFFRFCQKTLFVDLGCTPYFIGPIPFFSFQRDQWIFLGI